MEDTWPSRSLGVRRRGGEEEQEEEGRLGAQELERVKEEPE